MAQAYHPIWALLGWRTTGDVGPFTMYTSQRNLPVMYPRAPALNPPTPQQLYIRQRFKDAATGWKALTAAQRQEWEKATKLLRMGITGWNFWVSTCGQEGGGYVEYARIRTGLTLYFPPQAAT